MNSLYLLDPRIFWSKEQVEDVGSFLKSEKASMPSVVFTSTAQGQNTYIEYFPRGASEIIQGKIADPNIPVGEGINLMHLYLISSKKDPFGKVITSDFYSPEGKIDYNLPIWSPFFRRGLDSKVFNFDKIIIPDQHAIENKLFNEQRHKVHVFTEFNDASNRKGITLLLSYDSKKSEHDQSDLTEEISYEKILEQKDNIIKLINAVNTNDYSKLRYHGFNITL